MYILVMISTISLIVLFIGFVVPKVNQSLTKKIRHERKVEQEQQKILSPDTKTKDVADYGEIIDIFANVNEVSKVINNKKYSIKYNEQRNGRIELIVE